MTFVKDVFTGKPLCWHPECQWAVNGGFSGIEARYRDKEGNPVCWDHYKPEEVVLEDKEEDG